jgi:hypothetical protein
VPRLPTAVLVTGLEILAALSLTAGLVLDTVTRGRREQRLLAFLALPGPLEATNAAASASGSPSAAAAVPTAISPVERRIATEPFVSERRAR